MSPVAAITSSSPSSSPLLLSKPLTSSIVEAQKSSINESMGRKRANDVDGLNEQELAQAHYESMVQHGAGITQQSHNNLFCPSLGPVENTTATLRAKKHFDSACVSS